MENISPQRVMFSERRRAIRHLITLLAVCVFNGTVVAIFLIMSNQDRVYSGAQPTLPPLALPISILVFAGFASAALFMGGLAFSCERYLRKWFKESGYAARQDKAAAYAEWLEEPSLPLS